MSVHIIKNDFYIDSIISLALFRNVTNAKELRQNVMNGSFEAALLKPAMVIFRFLLMISSSTFIIYFFIID